MSLKEKVFSYDFVFGDGYKNKMSCLMRVIPENDVDLAVEELKKKIDEYADKWDLSDEWVLKLIDEVFL